MQIEYAYEGEVQSGADLIVKNKAVVASETVFSRFSSILLKDLP